VLDVQEVKYSRIVESKFIPADAVAAIAARASAGMTLIILAWKIDKSL